MSPAVTGQCWAGYYLLMDANCNQSKAKYEMVLLCIIYSVYVCCISEYIIHLVQQHSYINNF